MSAINIFIYFCTFFINQNPVILLDSVTAKSSKLSGSGSGSYLNVE